MATSKEESAHQPADPTALVQLRRELEDSRRSGDRSKRRAAQLRRQNHALIELARSEAIDRGDLERAFAQITEVAARTLDLERVGIWLFDDDRSALRCFDLYEAAVGKHSQGLELKAADYPRYFAALADQRALAADDAQSDPRTSEFREAYLEPMGITSMMDAAIVMGHRMIGVVCHEQIGSPRQWSLEEQMFGGSLSDFASIAIRARDRRRAEQRVAESEQRLVAAQRIAKIGSWEEDFSTHRVGWSDELFRILGFEPGAFEPEPDSLLERVPASERPALTRRIEEMLDVTDAFEVDHSIELPNGTVRFIAAQGKLERDAAGRPTRLVGTAQDVTERKRTVILRESRADTLERLATDAPLQEVLETLLLGVERLAPRMFCSILLVDADQRLRTGAAPSLPASYSAALDGLKIGPRVGSCGAAAATGERVIVENVMEHPIWEGFRETAAAAGLRACWSEPIRSSVGEILGTFAVYYGETRAPDDADLEMIATMAPVAGMVIERRNVERNQQMLMRELDHRVKNTLANVLAIAEQTAAESEPGSKFTKSLVERIRAMAIAHELLAGNRWEGAELREMVARTLGPYARGGSDRIEVLGDEVILPVAVAPPLCMVLHELATNAVRHGALSTPEGRVAVTWCTEGDRLQLSWRERGGPTVQPPQRSGFGTKLIEEMLPYQRRGSSELTFDPNGVRCTVEVDLSEKQ